MDVFEDGDVIGERFNDVTKELLTRTPSSRHYSYNSDRFHKYSSADVLESPLSATFHLCRVETNSSARKRSIRTRSLSSPLLDPCCRTLTLADDPQVLVEVDQNCKAKNPRRGERLEMGSCCSRPQRNEVRSSSDDDNSNDVTKDVGMTSVSKADLLNVQREITTDVTKGLEERWLRSHFQDKEERKPPESRSKRRKSVAELDADVINDTCDVTKIKHKLSVLHFNDVYEIAGRQREPVGGAARFAHALKSRVASMTSQGGEAPLVIFSGDCLNPSTLSCATNGRHMIEVLDELGVDFAVFGNHEFDFGVEHAAKCAAAMTSQWLLGNVTDKLTKRNLAEGAAWRMITRKDGLKVGILGLVEEEWLDTLATVDKNDLQFHDYVTMGNKVAKQLREDGAELVVAVTHMRWPNDIRLAQLVPEVDLVLGGHDHSYGVKEVDECLVIKSGSDFRNFSAIDVFLRHDGCVDVKVTRNDVTMEVAEDAAMKRIVDKYMSALEKSLDKCIGRMETDLDGRFQEVRTRETTLGNFVADIMATVTKCDVVIINSGTFRSDGVHNKGEFKLHDLMTILPINDTVVAIEATGDQLLRALENGVSKFPRLEGRFPQVSGLCFGFDPDRPPGSRIVPGTVRIGDRPLDPLRTYKVATKAYVARGRDGYGCLADCPLLGDPDSGPLLSTVVRNHIVHVNRLAEFQRANDCKVEISDEGRGVTTSDDLDLQEAFNRDGVDESPVTSLKKSMHMAVSEPATASQRHMPQFIAPRLWREPCSASGGEDAVLAGKVAALKKSRLRGGAENDRLLAERARTSSDLRWQIHPLVESRVFHCKEGDL